ncbi:hypothetical protein [Citrobacter koseri]|uniref:hypothetical protein n=1 Tax=Citrobacter koseri TaxID=545 RepID=UPI001908214B|nr:hypothetical protein [Citrobacter koseri]MBJ8867700.1 hypothetical protein [Citrobacter koseri]MBL4565673.1 hypothetical protein [Citrobacter koseri]
MKTIQLSERELSMILNMLTPPYAVSDTHTDEFNELRNKVFYALCDAQNDEPMQEQHKNAGLSKKCRRTEEMQVEPVSQRYKLTSECWCLTCRPVTMNDMRFVVCPDCGNKRCPRANDHRNTCSGSNEPGQIGSAYPAAPQQEARKSNVIGSYQGADGQEHPIVSLSSPQEVK